MGLDIFVMPLWRYKAGDFRSKIEETLGVRPKVATPGGIFEWFKSPGPFARRRARREVEAIRRAVEADSGVPIRWNDEGETVYNNQASGMEPLRAYARWLDLRDDLPEFGPAPEDNYYNHPAFALESDRPVSCPHLVGHSCFSGYFLPCEFDRLVQVEPYRVADHWDFTRSVGSTPRLRRELEMVAGHLDIPEGYDYPQDDPLVAVKASFLQLREVADLSLKHGLPIIFWG
jgi:hypothetical protein